MELAALAAAGGADPHEVRVIARRSLAPLRQVGAAWWIVRALRLLEGAGDASDAEVAEAMAVERRLGLADAAV